MRIFEYFHYSLHQTLINVKVSRNASVIKNRAWKCGKIREEVKSVVMICEGRQITEAINNKVVSDVSSFGRNWQANVNHRDARHISDSYARHLSFVPYIRRPISNLFRMSFQSFLEGTCRRCSHSRHFFIASSILQNDGTLVIFFPNTSIYESRLGTYTTGINVIGDSAKFCADKKYSENTISRYRKMWIFIEICIKK